MTSLNFSTVEYNLKATGARSSIMAPKREKENRGKDIIQFTPPRVSTLRFHST